jgi:hypothetical protein
MPIHRNRRAIWLLPFLILVTPLLLTSAGSDRTQPTKPTKEQREPSEITSIVYRVIANEWQVRTKLEEYSPRVETYIQYYKPDSELGDDATNDDYFLGRLKFALGKSKIATHAQEESFLPGLSTEPKIRLTGVLGAHLHMDEFAVQPLVVDENNFDRKHYTFDPVRWEYLGDVRCLAMDVHPRNHLAYAAFQGRIWVEDHNYAIVRMNGTRINPPHRDLYVHFDTWRENLQPGLWLPVYVYSQESDMGKRLRYKAETRLWGYDLNARHQQQEWTNIMVEAPAPIRDNSEVVSDLTPVESERQLTMDAEHNVLDRLEKARLIAPPGPVDKVLETVVSNLKVTNHLDNIPPVHCRVMLTSSLESFSLAYTIVLSRGLIDVLPDEPSLAAVVSHELAHIALGHKLDTKFAFNDRMQVTDEELLARLDIARPRADEIAADAKAVEFLKSSPYKENLGQAGLFMRAAAEAAPHVPHLFGAHLGNGLTEGNAKSMRMSTLINTSPALSPRNVTQIAALPLGSRVQVDAMDGTVAFTTRKAVPLVDASEKLPFRVTPVVPYLRTYAQAPKSAESAKN